jgi:UDP-glucose 4-epimerase
MQTKRPTSDTAFAAQDVSRFLKGRQQQPKSQPPRAKDNRLKSLGSTRCSGARPKLRVGILEQELGRKAERQLLPMQPGDVPATYADIDDLARDVDFRPATAIEDGIRQFAAWYRSYIIYNRRLTDP